MMANSAVKEGETERNRRPACIGPTRIFTSALQNLVKDRQRQNSREKHMEEFKAGISNKSSNEPIAASLKEPTDYEENFSSSNLKDSENPSRNFLKSYQSIHEDQNEPENNKQQCRMPRSYSSNSGDYHMNARHNIEKSKFSNNSKTNDNNGSNKYLKSNVICRTEDMPSIDKFCKNHNKSPSNSKQSFHENDDSHTFIPRMSKPARPRHNSNDFDTHMIGVTNSYHSKKGTNPNILKSESHIDSTSLKTVPYDSNSNQGYSSKNVPKNISRGNSNFKQFSYHQSQYHSYSNDTKKNCYPNQQCDSHKVNFNRNPPKHNFNRNIKENDPNQSTEVDDMEEDNFSNSNTNSKNDLGNVSTEIKHQRIFEDLDEKLKNSPNNKEMKNLKITCQLVTDSISNKSFISNSSSVPSVSDAPISPSLNTSTSLFSSTPISPVLNASSVFPDETISLESINSEFSPVLTNDNSILVGSNDVIPPPVEPCSASGKLCSSAEKSTTPLQQSESESTEECLYEDEDYFLLPDSSHIEAISNFIYKTVEERSVSFTVADKVVNDLQRLFKNHFEGNVIDYYGSYYTDLAITTSDINLVMKADASVKKSFMYEIYKILLNELEKYHVLPYDEGSNTYKSKVNFTHQDTGINCELTYLGQRREEKYLKMGKFLREMCNMDKRVKPLIIGVKVWAEHFNINEDEDGKLHPIGFALLVIHYLQHCENSVLPIYSEEKNIKDMKGDLIGNDLPIGTLWLGFLKYYAFTFNWQEDILTVTSVHRVSKKSKQWENYWVAIEDPFTGKNIAASVINKDVADYIKSCFKHTYEYFLNGKEFVSSDNDENQSGTESGCSQLEFSFNDCAIEQNEDICEMCEEIDDICDECKKKIYVQPLTAVPKMTDDFLKIVKKALYTVYDKYMLSDEEVEERKKFVKTLEINVRKKYKDARMRLFGSSANGFGFKTSDLDICMTFDSKSKYEAFAVLRHLRNLLQRNEDFDRVIAIFSAQIPILKFRYKPRGWRADISLDNVLAVHNSELLYTYSLIDERLKILGCALKLIAKKTLIADVTEKALSSYSYLIMVIHFLQQTDPPVLPILQNNLFRDNYELDDIVDSCNVWFCKNMDNIRKLFKTENHTPVEQLFLDLLDYYCSFDYEKVITICQKEIMTLPFYQGMRSARLFNIQDPFLLNKNLGCVVSPKKAQETKNIFNTARMLFRSPKRELPTDLENHFFSIMSLTGRIQKEIHCDCCGKYGHDQNDCKQSFPFKNNFFNHTRKKQYPNRNVIFRKKPMYCRAVDKNCNRS